MMKYVLVNRSGELTPAPVNVTSDGWVSPADSTLLGHLCECQFLTRPAGQCAGIHIDCWGIGVCETRSDAEQLAAQITAELAPLRDIPSDGGKYQSERHWFAAGMRKPFIDANGALHVDSRQKFPEKWLIGADEGCIHIAPNTQVAVETHDAYRPGPYLYGNPGLVVVPADTLMTLISQMRDYRACACGAVSWEPISHEEIRCRRCGKYVCVPDV